MSELKSLAQWRYWLGYRFRLAQDAPSYNQFSSILGDMAETIETAKRASDARIAELEAEVERLRAAPKVKPLEWREVTSPREDGPPEPTGEVEADTLIGCYSISIDGAAVDEGGVGWKWSAWTPFDSLGHFGDLDEAKSAAQADYEARVLSALVQP